MIKKLRRVRCLKNILNPIANSKKKIPPISGYLHEIIIPIIRK